MSAILYYHIINYEANSGKAGDKVLLFDNLSGEPNYHRRC